MSLRDPVAERELARFSPEKLAEPWSGRPAQKQVFSNVLEGRGVPREARAEIVRRMKGRSLGELSRVVAEAFAGVVSPPDVPPASRPPLSLGEIRARVAEIEDECRRGDDEAAHSLEDRLYLDVLRDFADAGFGAAAEAIRTQYLRFDRHCS